MSLPSLVLRSATPDDRVCIGAAIDAACGCPEACLIVQRLSGTPSAMTDRVFRFPEWCIVASYRGRAIGHISCWQDEMLGLIGSHVVLKAYRGFGVGAGLLEEMIRRARAEGLRLLEAVLRTPLTRACRLYERRRFHETALESDDGWIRYECRLDGPT